MGEEPQEDEVPEYVGPYRVVEPLGSGGFATVYKAIHEQTRCVVALKAIRKSGLRTMEEFELIRREVSVMKGMDHPFIASFFELLDDDNCFYLVIELVENGDLLEYINANNGLGEPQARRIFFQLVTVLNYLHREKRVAHRDLKAENVLLDSNHNIRLVDFGLSKPFSKDNPFLQTCCGSPGYVSPEIIREQPYTAASDVWSLGILLWAMLQADLPFYSDNMPTMLNLILTSQPNIPAHLSPELRDLIQRLLVKDPTHRITIPQILDHPWLSEYADSAMNVGNTLKIQDVAELDARVVTAMQTLGVSTDGLLERLNDGEIGHGIAIYKMLRRELLVSEINQWQRSRVAGRGRQRAVAEEAPAVVVVPIEVPKAKAVAQGRVKKRVVQPKVAQSGSKIGFTPS
jgi:serine/threonine protein kinase